MSHRRATSELLQKLLMASNHLRSSAAGCKTSKKPSLLRAAASSLSTRALESSTATTPWPPPSHRPLARRPRFFFDPPRMHTSALLASSLTPSRLFNAHKAHRSISAAATSSSIDAAASSTTDANCDDNGGDESLDSFLAPPSVTFASLGLDSQVCDALRAAGIAHPSAVQVRQSRFFSSVGRQLFFFLHLLNELSRPPLSIETSLQRPPRSLPCCRRRTLSSQRRRGRGRRSPI